MSRRGYLDWLRGAAVLVMIAAHTFDAWTSTAGRLTPGYRWAILLGGFGAPAFLFLAGVALTLAVDARLRRGCSAGEALRLARRRGWQVFGLAFLFRLQSWAISGGELPWALLKVDILNILGLSMVAAAGLWGLAGTRPRRMAVFTAAAALVVGLAPLVLATPLVAALPDPLEWYARPWAGHSTFTLFPWPAFLLVGAAVGEWLLAARTPGEERRANVAIGAAGLLLALVGYAASFMTAAYDERTLWTIAPSFFLLRLGILMMTLPVAFEWMARRHGFSPLREFGVSSLFVYWIHVEMAYGVLTLSIHRSLTFGQATVAYVAFCVGLFALVRLKNRLTSAGQPRLMAAPN